MKKLDSLEKKLKIKFAKKELLKKAFIHRSYLNETDENLESNERLEFLGDAVLEFVASGYLFSNYPEMAEGKLTTLRSILVCTKTLSEVANSLGLGNFLFLSHGEEESGGRKNETILANTVESLIGAIYLDRGLKSASQFIEDNILAKSEEIIKNNLTYDYKSKLQEIVQADFKLPPLYKVISESGPDHAKKFKVGLFVGKKVYGYGVGSSKQRAEQKAAYAALEKWAKLK